MRVRIWIGGVIGLTFASAVHGETTPVPASAPPPAAVRVPPPVVRAYPEMETDRRVLPVVPVQIRISMNSQLLWNGALNIGGIGQARMSLSEPVAGTGDCDRSGDGRAMRQIELSVYAQSYRPVGVPNYRLSVRYSRPGDGGDCPSGTRSIAIDQGFSLGDRKVVTFEGDGGLKVQLSAP